MPTPGAPPNTLSVNTAVGPDQLELVGPAIWGLIYRSVRRPFFYRLLDGEEAVGQIQRGRAWVNQPPRPGLARAAEVNHSFDPELNFYFVRYEVPATGPTLQEILATCDLPERLNHLSLALGQVHDWWRNTGNAVMATPAEIVFPPGGKALLLAAPFRAAVTVSDVLRQPVRARYLAPGILRGTVQSVSDAEDAHAFAAMLAECLYRQSELEPAEMLLRAAASELLDCRPEVSRMPAWVGMLPSTVEACRETARLLERRQTFEPANLRFQIDDWVRRLDPLAAIGELRQSGRFEQAVELIRAMMPEAIREPALAEKLYEVALLGAAIAENDLKRPLDAVEFQERAIACRPALAEAYRAQMALIARLDAEGAGMLRELDSMLWRDFGYLSQDDQMWHETTVSRYLLNRDKHAEAAKFIYPRLLDPQGRPLEGKYELNLDYVEALIGLKAVEQAEPHLNWVRNMLGAGLARNSVRPAEAERLTRTIRRLEEAMDRARGRGGRRGQIQ